MASERCAGAGSDSDSCGGGDKPGSNNKSTYKSVEQCKNKIDNLKKRYKVEIRRMSNGGQTVSHWHWFKQIDTIAGSSGAIKSASDEERGSGGNSAVAKQSKRYMSSNSVLANTVKTKPVMNLKWNRVVFKISGAALSGDCQSRDTEMMMQVAREVAIAFRLGVEVAIVAGGRNFFCGDIGFCYWVG